VRTDFVAEGRTYERDALALMCALFAVHIPLLFNDGLFQDDWLLFRIQPGYPINLDFLLHGASHPLIYAYCALADLSGHPIAFMEALAMTGILLGAANLQGFLRRLGWFSNLETSIFAFIVWSYAGYQDWATKVLATYVFSMALLCVGLNILAGLVHSNRPHLGWRLCGLAALYCSFSLNSMIIPYLIGFCAVFVAVASEPEGDQRISTRRSLMLAMRYVDFLAIPVLYWISINLLFPTVGQYQDYYRMRLPSAAQMLSELASFWRWGYVELARSGLLIAKAMHKLALLALVSGIAFALIGGRPSNRKAPAAATIVWLLIGAIAVFLACAIPYIVSGVGPDGHFFESRHLILFGIPLALALLACSRLIRRGTGSDTFAGLAAGAALSLNLCALWDSYFLQEARWLRMEALIDGLQSKYPKPPATVFDLADGFLDHGGHTYFGTTEISGALHLAWHDGRFFGFTGRNERSTILQETAVMLDKEGSPLRNIDLWGPQATINFVPKPPILAYYDLSISYYRCAIRLCDTKAFLEALADTSIQTGRIHELAPRSAQ
jgi:hypothetical protein